MAKPIVIFCDFDGTITERDMIVSLVEKFAAPGYESIRDGIFSQQISVQEGVERMFQLIPSAKKDELVQYALETAKIRDGFQEFVTYCTENGITFLVTSGGIDFFVEPILNRFKDIERIYCNSADFSGKNIRILWPHGCDEHCDGGCGLCKPSLVRDYPAEQFTRVVIGDSVTDLKAARLADLVIARSLLLKTCGEEGLSHEPFTDFHDVLTHIKQLQQKEVSL
jgi:2-hydroxy-3-keto-5-methylthiopentenyl-1-phosphate phosphatase